MGFMGFRVQGLGLHKREIGPGGSGGGVPAASTCQAQNRRSGGVKLGFRVQGFRL